MKSCMRKLMKAFLRTAYSTPFQLLGRPILDYGNAFDIKWRDGVERISNLTLFPIFSPLRLATQSRSSTSCTTSSGSPSSRDEVQR